MAHSFRERELLQVVTEVMEVPCDACGSIVGVKLEPCRTAYADESQNVDYWFCRDCAIEYHTHWDEMWENYNNSRM